jgi:hypothetical protein
MWSGRAISHEIERRAPVAPARHASATRRVTSIDRALPRRVQRGIDAAELRLELWDGSSPYRGSDRLGDLFAHNRGTLLGLAFNSDLYFGDRYVSGRRTVRGSILKVHAMSRLTPEVPPLGQRVACCSPAPTIRAAPAPRRRRRRSNAAPTRVAAGVRARVIHLCRRRSNPGV